MAGSVQGLELVDHPDHRENGITMNPFKRPPTPHRPLPELVERGKAGPWTIEHIDKGGHTNLTDRKMAAPLTAQPCPDCGNDHNRYIRIHELAHVRWSPKRIPTPWKQHRPELILLAEDLRIHDGLTESQISTPWNNRPQPGTLTCNEDDIAGPWLGLITGNPDAALPLITFLFGDMFAGRSAYATRNHIGHIDDGIHDLIDDHSPPGTRSALVEASQSLAYYLRDAAYDLEDILDNHKRRLGAAVRAATPELAQRLEQLLQHLTQTAQEALRALQTEAEDDTFGFEPGDDTLRAGWGEMTIHHPPLTLRHRFKKRMLRTITRTTGKQLDTRKAVRHLIQGKPDLFTNRIRKPGGTVLVDVSGSMSLSEHDIDRIIDAAPAALVAIYSGSEDRETGKLQIVADKARRVEHLPRHDCLNIIDGPALTWLGQQREPRLWVSDGYVTGIDENQDHHHLDDRDHLVGRYRITQVDDAFQAIDHLEDR